MEIKECGICQNWDGISRWGTCIISYEETYVTDGNDCNNFKEEK